MRKLWVIAHREYVAMVGTKAFLFTLVMMPILMFGSLLVMPLVNRVSGGKTHKIAIADGTHELFDHLSKAVSDRNRAIQLSKETDSSNPGSNDIPKSTFMGQDDTWELIAAPNEMSDEQRLEYSNQIRAGTLYALVELPKNLLVGPVDHDPSLDASELPAAPKPRFYSQDALISGARGWFGSVLSSYIRSVRIRQNGLENIDPKVLAQLDTKVELTPNSPVKPAQSGKTEGQSAVDSLISLFLPFGVMMLMFMVILMAAQPMLESAMEEKSLRISELLLGSVKPTQLMGGKLLGNVAGSLVIFILYGAGALFSLNMTGFADRIPLGIVPWFLLFQLLGVLFFSSIFLTVGASVNELKEAQTMLLPVWMVLMAPMMVWFIAVRDPNGIVATSLSFFPPSCPMMMMLRLASGTTVPIWQPCLGAVIMIASTLAMVMLAGKIYRTALLRNEGVRSFSQLLRRSFS